MFLAATTDINTYVELATNAGAGVINPEVFYSKILLDTIRISPDQYVYYRLADTQPIGEKADKLQMRRWSPLQAHTTRLVEGVPPISDKGSVEKYELDAYAYGRYMEFTDKVDYKVVDPVIAHYTKEYSIVAIETLDLLARNALFSVAQKNYAGGAANFAALTLASKPSMTDLRLIVLAMKKNLIKPRTNGRYHVICSAEFTFDMISDPIVEKYMTINNSTKTMYDNSTLVPLFEMEFYETLCVPTNGKCMSGTDQAIALYRPTTVKAAENGMTNSTIVDGYEYIVVTKGEANANPSTTAYGATIKVTSVSGYVKDARTGADASYIPNQEVWDVDGWNTANKGETGEDWKEFKAQHILVVGKDALLRTGLAGEDSAKVYVKPLGSSGVLDPINQRQSIGFKINSVGFGSVRLEAVQDYICVPSQVN